MKNTIDQHSQWSYFWRRGYINTFGPAMPQNYDDDVKVFWYKQFNQLKHGAVILDVAAGNGAVATIAAEYSEIHNKSFAILAADAAEIDFELV